MALNDLLAPVAGSLLQSIKKITVETAYLPRIELNDPFAPGPPNPLMQILKPKITIETIGFAPMTMQPYGEPGPSKWPVVSIVFLAGTIALAFAGWKMLQKRRR